MRAKFASSPLWVRGIATGLTFGIFMAVFSWFQTGSLTAALIGGLVGGTFFGLAMSLVMRRWSRRQWPRASEFSAAEQRRILEVVSSGRPADDPRLTAAARDLLVRQQEGLRRHRTKYLVFFSVFALGYVALAATQSAWWLLGTATFIGGDIVTLASDGWYRRKLARLDRQDT